MSLDPAPLFQPLRLGNIELPNRIAMAPLTRSMFMPPSRASRSSGS